MRRRVLAGIVVATMIVLASGSARARGPQVPAGATVAVPADASASSTTPQRVLLDRYCVTCHNSKTKAGDLALDAADVTKVGVAPDVWEKVVRKLRAGMMPPVGRPRPDQATYDGFAAWVETELDRAAAEHPNPGRTEPFHRLNRTEYRNAIRDLLALDADVGELLPADNASYGFDNMAGVLKVNQSLMERYLAAARKISRTAVGSVAPAPLATTFRVSDEYPQYDRIEGLPFGTRGGTLLKHHFPQDAEYEFLIVFACTRIAVVNSCDGISGFPDPHKVEVTIDGERVKLFTFEPKSRRSMYATETAENARPRFRIAVKAGVHDVGVAFIKLPSAEEADGLRTRFEKPFLEVPWISPNMAIYQPALDTVTISGPFDAQGAGNTASRRAIFSCRPTKAAKETRCAKTILSTLARKAYRRPVTDADVQPLLRFYDDGRADGGFDGGIEVALQRLLVSPEFLFRVETEPRSAVAGSSYRISDLELASRLSFFLWSSIPDETLIDLAARGRLKDRAVLDQQVRRMLADPRSSALTSNFAVQWLQLRKLGESTPAYDVFPDFDESLREAFRRETELFFDSVLREDRSLTQLLTANYTFVNERLARHYGIPNVLGSDFRRVTLVEDSPRRGLLGQGSILTQTSHAIRTSPVFRGKWILQTLIGVPPPEPPANVPPLEEKKATGAKALSMRERMAEHRANPVCAGCHSMIEPLGFALENFDPIGRWRTMDDTYTPIDPSGMLPDGTRFDDLRGFRAALTRHPERLAIGVTTRMLTYAVGRGAEYYDMPTVRRIVRDAAPREYTLPSIIAGIVHSDAFQMRASLSSGVAIATTQR